MARRRPARQLAAELGGGLGDILGGMLGGAAAGSVLNGGLGQVLQDLQRSGQGGAAQSWVGRGENEQIAPDDLANALGADTISALTQQTGLSRDDLLQGLSQNLPDFVDQLTPEGRPADRRRSAALVRRRADPRARSRTSW